MDNRDRRPRFYCDRSLKGCSVVAAELRATVNSNCWYKATISLHSKQACNAGPLLWGTHAVSLCMTIPNKTVCNLIFFISGQSNCAFHPRPKITRGNMCLVVCIFAKILVIFVIYKRQRERFLWQLAKQSRETFIYAHSQY